MSFLDTVGEDWVDEAKAADPVEQVETPEAKPEEVETTEGEESPEVQEEKVEEKPEGDKVVHTVPYAEMKREREKRHAAERRAEEAEKRAQSVPVQQAPQSMPDAYEDPRGFEAYMQAREDQIRYENRLEVSSVKAETKYGEETVKAAVDWALSLNDPVLGQKVRSAASPVEFVVREFQQSKTLETIAGKTPEEFARDYAISQGWIVSPEAEGSSSLKPSPSKAPPRSLASKPGSGGVGTAPVGDAFDGIFSSTGLGLKKG